eukprot:g1066.t1
MKMSLRSRLTSVVLLFTVLATFVAGSMAFKDGSFENLRRQGRALFQTPSSRERTDLFACQLCEPRSVCVGRVNWCPDRDRPSPSPASSPSPEDITFVCRFCDPISICRDIAHWCR